MFEGIFRCMSIGFDANNCKQLRGLRIWMQMVVAPWRGVANASFFEYMLWYYIPVRDSGRKPGRLTTLEADCFSKEFSEIDLRMAKTCPPWLSTLASFWVFRKLPSHKFLLFFLADSADFAEIFCISALTFLVVPGFLQSKFVKCQAAYRISALTFLVVHGFLQANLWNARFLTASQLWPF